MLIDSHCHLNWPILRDDLGGVLERAKQSNIKVLHTICTKLDEVELLLSICEKYSDNELQIFCSIGVHPLNVEESGVIEYSKLVSLCQHQRVISLGETGLDYYRGSNQHDIQQQSFINHIRAAQETKLPLVIHTRDADLDTVSILSEHMKKTPFSAVIHCFTSTEWLADACLELGLYLSASGIITFKNTEVINSVFKKTPLMRILVETDAPFLAPVPKRGKSNEPSYIVYTAEYLANLKGLSYNETLEQTTKNFFELFTKAGSYIITNNLFKI